MQQTANTETERHVKEQFINGLNDNIVTAEILKKNWP